MKISARYQRIPNNRNVYVISFRAGLNLEKDSSEFEVWEGRVNIGTARWRIV